VSPPTTGGFSFSNRILRPINHLRYTRQPSCIDRVKSHVASRAFEETRIFNRGYGFEDLLSIFFRHAMADAAGEFDGRGARIVSGRPVTFVGGAPDETLALERYADIAGSAIKGGRFQHSMRFFTCLMVVAAFVSAPASAQHDEWSTSWAASVQGPYPVGNPSAQPDQRFAFPTPAAGTNDQTFRLVVRPDLWGRQARLRLSNVFGTRPVTFDGIFVGLRLDAAAVVPGIQQAAALANAIAESGLNPTAHNTTGGEDSVGLFQLNRNGGEGAGHTVEELEDHVKNIEIVVSKVKSIGDFTTAQILDDAVAAFVAKFERPNDPNAAIAQRQAIAHRLLRF
jgi:hypothetical protein